jgi:hypothetical protein
MKLNSLLSRAAVLWMVWTLRGMAAAPADLDARVKDYTVTGRALVEMAQTKKVDVAVVGQKVDHLVEIASRLAKDYAVAFPAGKKLIETVVAAVPEMRKLSFKELESEWHDLKHFEKAGNEPGLDLKAEDNEHFTDPVHAIVHPLLVLKAAEAYGKTPGPEPLKQIKEEMEEGLEQAEKLRIALSK